MGKLFLIILVASMPFLNLDLNYEDHPKTKRLVGLLGRGAELIPIRIWSYCGKYHAENGEMTAHSPQEIESIVKWWGKPGQAVGAMLKVGFLEKIKGGFRVHDWKETQGHIHALKLQAKHAAQKRWASLREKHAVGMPSASPTQSPVPFRTEPNRTKPLTLNGASPSFKGTNDGGLVEEIVSAFDDEKSRGFYINAARQLGDGLLREIFADVQSKIREGRDIRNPAAYFADQVKREISVNGS